RLELEGASGMRHGLEKGCSLWMACSEAIGVAGPVAQHLELRKLEARAHRTPDEGEGAGGAGGLPGTGGDDVYRAHSVGWVSQKVSIDPGEVAIHTEQLQRLTFVEVPGLVGGHAVPPAHVAGGKQEVDGGERGAVGPPVERLHARLRAVDLSV